MLRKYDKHWEYNLGYKRSSYVEMAVLTNSIVCIFWTIYVEPVIFLFSPEAEAEFGV